MSVEQTQENGQVPSVGSGELVRRFRVHGVCLVPTEVTMYVLARNENEAVARAMNSKWRNHIANGHDDSAAYDWEPEAFEVAEPNK